MGHLGELDRSTSRIVRLVEHEAAGDAAFAERERVDFVRSWRMSSRSAHEQADFLPAARKTMT